MCGICGFAGPGDAAVLAAMNRRMAHRGPDGQGSFHHPESRLFLAHNRLAIVDLTGGAQPMATADRELTVTFNGEIYNHAQLRRQLEDKGHRFRTDHCDTEVLLHGYREWGEELPERLNGMWAFALHDRAARRLFLSRDRFGKKPLFYAALPGLFAFASELSGLMEHPGVPADISPLALKKYFAYGFIPAPHSLYAAVRKLPGGHTLTLDLTDLAAAPRIRCAWSFCVEPVQTLPKNPEAHWGEAIRDTLERSVVRRLMSDVPLGVFLSGGIDSTAVTALAARHVPGLRTFSVGFEEASFDESAHSRRAAALYQTNHHQNTLSLTTALSLLPELAARLDEPLGDSSLLPTYLLCRDTRAHVTVALGGDGADELFAGYAPFKALRTAEAYAALCPRPVHRALRMLAARLPVNHGYMSAGYKVRRFLLGLDGPKPLWNPLWLGPASPEELEGLFAGPSDPEEIYQEAITTWEGCPSRDLVDKTLEFYTRLYLQDGILVKVDRASMLNSLEVRAPFLDIEMVDLARSIPHAWKFRRGQGKYILKKALEPLVPKDILYRSKQGFGAPIGLWFRQGSLTLSGQDALPGLDPGFIAAKALEHRQGRADHRLLLWNLWILARHRGRSTAACSAS